MEISTGLRDRLADTTADLYDGGVLEIRSGAAPGAGAADAGTLLVSIPLPTPAFGAASNGQADKSGTWEDTSADASGTAAHFRIKQSGDAGGADASQDRIEGSVTATGGGGDIELDSVDITAGQSVTITAFNIHMPAS